MNWSPYLLASALGVFATCALAQVAPDRLAVGAAEGRVVIYAATDQNIVQPLIDDFEQRHPGIKVEYHDMHSNTMYQRVIDEAQRGSKADVVWSSAMDLQVKLVNDGYAQSHRSAETAALPSWAVWKNEAFGTTYEPAVFVYHKPALQQDELPGTHAALIALLKRKPARFLGRLATYDPRLSGVGLLLHTQDAQSNPIAFWSLVETLGDNGIRSYATSASMLDSISSGETLIGYNVLGSYALTRAQADPRIGVIWPQDYTLVLSRVAFITRDARHPQAARLWLDHLLSRRGQTVLARNAGLFAVREDVTTGNATGLRTQLGAAFRPIPIGSGLLTYLDQAKQRDFLRQWEAAIKPR